MKDNTKWYLGSWGFILLGLYFSVNDLVLVAAMMWCTSAIMEKMDRK